MEYKTLNKALADLEFLKKYTVYSSLKDSPIHFGQPPVLEYLQQNGDCTQNELAGAMGVSPASMAVSIKRMQKSGLVVKKSSTKDLRCNKISITDEGIKCLEQLKASFEEIDNTMFSDFSEEELLQFKEFIDRLNSRLFDNLNDKKGFEKFVKKNLYCEKGEEKDV